MLTFDDFMKVDIRVGTVIDIQPFPEAKHPALKLWVDFGDEFGIKKTSAQITQNYSPASLIGRQVCGVINFPPKQIASFMSEFLILGFPDENGHITLITPDKSVPDGGRLL